VWARRSFFDSGVKTAAARHSPGRQYRDQAELVTPTLRDRQTASRFRSAVIDAATKSSRMSVYLPAIKLSSVVYPARLPMAAETPPS
jgi:hypothetical protein